jgi:hypothetical protein
MRAGIKLESETIGEGREATRGDTVTVSYDLALNRGDVVQSLDSFVFTRNPLINISTGHRRLLAVLCSSGSSVPVTDFACENSAESPVHRQVKSCSSWNEACAHELRVITPVKECVDRGGSAAVKE